MGKLEDNHSIAPNYVYNFLLLNHQNIQCKYVKHMSGIYFISITIKEARS